MHCMQSSNTPEDQAVHPLISKIVSHITDNNAYLKSHIVQGRPSVRRVSVVKMDSSPPTLARSRFQPQHHWHKDGGTSLITVVFTLYNGEWDSKNSPGAFELGGRVPLADRPCGTAVYADSIFTSVRSGRIRTYFPRTNSLFSLPGQHVSHAFFRVEDPVGIRSFMSWIIVRAEDVQDCMKDCSVHCSCSVLFCLKRIIILETIRNL